MDLILVLSDECKRRCRYCYADARRGGPMTMALGERAVDLALSRSPSSLRIGFFGGEPLLQFSLLRRLTDYACDRASGEANLSFHLTTNGDLLRDEVARYLRSRRFDVGLSAHEEDPGDARGKLDLLFAAGIEPRVVLVADPVGAHAIPSRVGRLLAAGVRKVAISPDYYAAWNTAARYRLTLAYRELAELYRRRADPSDSFRLNLFDARLSALRCGVPLRQSHCRIGRDTIAVAPDGSLFPCDRMSVDASSAGTRIGHLDTGIDEQKLERLADDRRRLPEACLACRNRSICAQFCTCVKVRLTGRLRAAPEVVCWHESMLCDIVRGLHDEAEASRAASTRRPRRFRVQVTAGLAVAAALTSSCGSEQPATAPQSQAASPATATSPVMEKVWITYPKTGPLSVPDKNGLEGTVYLKLLTGLPADRLHCLLAENAEPIAALVQEKFAQIELDSLSDPEAEQALGKELLQAIGQATGVREELKGIRLEVDAPPAWAERLGDLQLEQLRALGYVVP